MKSLIKKIKFLSNLNDKLKICHFIFLDLPVQLELASHFGNLLLRNKSLQSLVASNSNQLLSLTVLWIDWI